MYVSFIMHVHNGNCLVRNGILDCVVFCNFRISIACVFVADYA